MRSNKSDIRCSKIQVLLQRVNSKEILVFSELADGLTLWKLKDESGHYLTVIVDDKNCRAFSALDITRTEFIFEAFSTLN